ncbi:multidrug ABC transporter ATP-binding protein [Clostridia bacterium]|nr:multidrug ABC transporter ATP-binding protein [Clostridia bacterium]
MNIIEIANLSLTIKNQKILEDVNIFFEKGKIHGIIGRNGSGKTMLMKCICGFVKPDCGEILVDGKKVGIDVDFPESVSFIIETPAFIPYYSGFKNLNLLYQLRHKSDKKYIKDVIRKVGLNPELKKSVKKYSLGMRQRLGLAQAIMDNSPILILDEPMNGLDKQGVSDMREYFKGLRTAGKTLLIASHSAEDITELCDTVCEMDNGVLVG